MKNQSLALRACGLLLTLFFGTLSSCSATSDVSGEEPTALRLFNGLSLNGWEVDHEDAAELDGLFRIHNGVLICRGTPTAVLRTAEEFENYELLLERRWAPGSEGGNSGLLLHCSTPRYRGVWPRSIEAQLKSGSAAGFYLMGEGVEIEVSGDQERRKGSWIPRCAGLEHPIGQWNRMRAVCKGSEITLYLNGELANQGRAASESRGAIALQSEGAEIHFRRVDLRRLTD